MTTKKLLPADFAKAGIDQQIVDIFNQIWPDGMDVTLENIQLGAATGMDIYYLAQSIVSKETWGAFLAAEQALIAANELAIATKKRTLAAAITGMRLGIFATLGSTIESLGATVTSLSANPAVVVGWDQDPEVLLQPFRAALTTVQAGVNTHLSNVATQKQVVAGQVVTVNNELEVAKLQALVDAINAAPEELLPEQPQGVMSAETLPDSSPKPETPFVPAPAAPHGPTGHGPGI